MRGEGRVNPCTDLPLRPDPIPCFCRGRSTRGEGKVNPCTDLPPRADRNPRFCRGRSMRGEGKVNPCTDLPLRADRGVLCQSNPLCFVGAGLRAERARSIHAQTCPYAQIAIPYRAAAPAF